MWYKSEGGILGWKILDGGSSGKRGDGEKDQRDLSVNENATRKPVPLFANLKIKSK